MTAIPEAPRKKRRRRRLPIDATATSYNAPQPERPEQPPAFVPIDFLTPLQGYDGDEADVQLNRLRAWMLALADWLETRAVDPRLSVLLPAACEAFALADVYGWAAYADLLYEAVPDLDVQTITSADHIAAYESRQDEGSRWRQWILDATGVRVDASADELWQLMQQVSYAMERYEEACNQ